MNRPKKVDIYELRNGQDTFVGSLVFDGKTVVADPPDDHTLRVILADSVFTPKGPIGAEQPEAFLEALPKQYRSAYLRAVPA